MKLPDLKAHEHPTIAGFWEFCLEREQIRTRKESGMSSPWTQDIILEMYFFCNVRREDDRGTRWYLKNVITDCSIIEHRTTKELLWKTILYRAINNVKYFEGIGGVFGESQWQYNKDLIWDKIERGPLPSSPAYIVLQGPDGRERKDHLKDLIDHLENNIFQMNNDINNAKDLKYVWKRLQMVPYVGPFIALQVYRDLILADSLPFTDDDFTYLGPGARQGLQLFGFYEYPAQYLAIKEIQKAHPSELELNLGDVEQAMCEYRKYCNLRAGGGRHRYYNVASN